MGFFLTTNQPTLGQEFHTDYHPKAETFFIPMVPISTFSYISTNPSAILTEDKHREKDDLDMLEREGLDYMDITKIISKEYTILHLLKNNILRNTKNLTDYDMPMFFAYCVPDKEAKVKEIDTNSDKPTPKRKD